MKRVLMKAALAACLVSGGTSARAADFIFTFGSDLSDPNVDLASAFPGTVTGRILGLADDGTSSAQSVFIDIYSPDGTVVPVDAMLWFWPYPDQANSFTVENGAIISAIFQRSSEFSPSFDRLYINVPIYGLDGTNYASLGSNNSTSIWNNLGMQGITFTRIDTAVPEPATWVQLLLGFGAIGFAIRRSRELNPT